jgi:transposase
LATRRAFTQEYRDQAVNLVLHSGRTIRDVAKTIGVHEITLGKWVSKAKEGEPDPDKDLSETERAELARLRKEIVTLRMERDFAKKVAAWFAKQQP